MELEYDPTKDAVNIAKNGISLADAMLVYNAANKLTLESVRNGENRLMDAALVCCLRNTQTESTHGIEDLISRFCPHKGVGILVVSIKVLSNGLFKRHSAAMGTASDLFACDQIGRASGRERLCQYVYISVVDVSLTIQSTDNDIDRV